MADRVLPYLYHKLFYLGQNSQKTPCSCTISALKIDKFALWEHNPRAVAYKKQGNIVDKSPSSPSQMAIEQLSEPAQYYENRADELDLKDLFLALWKGKWLIIACALIFGACAVAYSLVAQEWWSSKAKVIMPQAQDLTAYALQTKKYQPIFDIYQEDGTVLVSEELSQLTNPEMLFSFFISAFNSNKNKKQFLDTNEVFLSIKDKLDSNRSGDSEVGTGLQSSYQQLYNEWYRKITAVPTDRRIRDEYELSVQSMSQESSFKMLQDYLLFIANIEREGAINNLNTKIDAKKYELEQKSIVLTNQAKLKVEVELKRAEYAYQIAKAADVNSPVQILGDKEIFSINLGSKAINEKIKALKDIKNYSLIEPKLQQIKAKLNLLNNITVDDGIEFQSFRYIEEPELAVSRDKPKRLLIVMFGGLIGGMLGIAIIAVRFTIKQKKGFKVCNPSE